MSEDRVSEVRRRWATLPAEVKLALVVARAYEEEGAYNLSILADPVRGFFRQSGGAAAVSAKSEGS